MSDGTYNKPIRSTHPESPTIGRVKEYIYDDNGNPTPYFIGSDNIPRTLKGDDGQDGQDGANGSQGLQGEQGIQGDQGPQGTQGPAGAMTVEAFISKTATVTLPNSSSSNIVYTDPVNFDGAGSAYLDISLAVRAYSSSSDMEFDIRFDGVVLDPLYNEEHKDSSGAQSNWRSQCFDLGNVTSGAHTLDLLFSKENTGGTAQLKNYTAKIVRYT